MGKDYRDILHYLSSVAGTSIYLKDGKRDFAWIGFQDGSPLTFVNVGEVEELIKEDKIKLLESGGLGMGMLISKYGLK